MTTPSSPTARTKYSARSARIGASDVTWVEWPTTVPRTALTSTVRRCPAGTTIDELLLPAPSTLYTRVTLAAAVPGFWRVTNSLKPSCVDPSANDHRVRAPWAPSTVWLPFTVRPEKARSKYIERSATNGTLAPVMPTETPVRP